MRGLWCCASILVFVVLLIACSILAFEISSSAGELVREPEDTLLLWFNMFISGLAATTIALNVLFVFSLRFRGWLSPIFFHGFNAGALLVLVLLGLVLWLTEGLMSVSDKGFVSVLVVVIALGYREGILVKRAGSDKQSGLPSR